MSPYGTYHDETHFPKTLRAIAESFRPCSLSFAFRRRFASNLQDWQVV